MGLLKESILLLNMSDNEEDTQPKVIEEEKSDNIHDALRIVLKKSHANDGLVKGLNEVCKALDKREDIGEWLGQCKYDKTGTARRVRGASSAAIKDYGEETEALNFVLNHIKENNA